MNTQTARHRGKRATRTVARISEGLARVPAAALVAQLSVGLALVGLTVGLAGLGNRTIPKQELTYFLCFAGWLPLAFVVGAQLTAGLTANHGRRGAAALSALAAASALAVVLVARLTGPLGLQAAPVLVAGMTCWALAVAAVAWRPEAAGRLATVLARRPRGVWAAAAAAAVLGVVAVLPPRSLRPGAMALSLLLAALLTGALQWRKLRYRPRLMHALDVAVFGAIVLLIVDALGYLQYLPYDPYSLIPLAQGHPANLFDTPGVQAFALQLHEDFFMAPVNDVLHGRPMLVDTYSQYGVGLFYFLAAWFKLAPLGYGPLGLLCGVMTGLAYGCAYATLRVAGARASVAGVALGAAVLAFIYGAYSSITLYPSTGGLRWLWAYLLILVIVAGARRPAWRRRARSAALGILAVSAVWSIEMMVYALTVVVAAAGFEALVAEEQARERWRRLAVHIACAIGVCVTANLLLAVATRALSGRWPDWRPYLAFFLSYGGGDVLRIRAPLVHPWASFFGVAGIYFASALGLVTSCLSRPQFARERKATLMAVATCTAFGIVSLTYFTVNSDPGAMLAWSPPAIMVVVLWLTVAGDPRTAIPRLARVGALASGLWIAALLVVFAWPRTESKWGRSVLWQALPGTTGLRGNLKRQWSSPPLDPRSVEAAALLARHVPARQRVAVLMEPDLTVETLVRARRANALPVGDLIQDNLIRKYTQPRLDHAIGALKPGALMLVQLRPEPRIAPLEGSFPPLQRALARVRQRFALQVVATSQSRLSVVRLAPSPPPPSQHLPRARTTAGVRPQRPHG